MARPQIQIDKTQFENLCKLQCTLQEIAGWFGCSEDTIERWCKREYKQSFADVFSKKREAGKISLRRNLVRLSERNPAAAIFLAKNWLGMSDKMEEKVTVNTAADDETARAMQDFFSQKKQSADKAEN